MKCKICQRRIYLDTRPGGAWKHYATDSQFCYPDLSITEAFGSEAVPDART